MFCRVAKPKQPGDGLLSLTGLSLFAVELMKFVIDTG